MKFEELQVIWNTQNQRPLYAIDETALQAELWGQRQSLRRAWFRWNILAAYLGAGLGGVAVAVAFSDTGFTGRAGALSVAAGIAMLYFVAATLRDQRQEKRREVASTGSLREELDRGIANLEYQIRAGGGGSANWKAIPLIVSLSLALLALAEVKGLPKWPAAAVGGLMLLTFPIEVWRHRRRVTRDLRPRKRTLESLRANLTRPPGT